MFVNHIWSTIKYLRTMIILVFFFFACLILYRLNYRLKSKSTLWDTAQYCTQEASPAHSGHAVVVGISSSGHWTGVSCYPRPRFSSCHLLHHIKTPLNNTLQCKSRKEKSLDPIFHLSLRLLQWHAFPFPSLPDCLTRVKTKWFHILIQLNFPAVSGVSASLQISTVSYF